MKKELFELKCNPNIIEIPDNATNGDMIKALFDCELNDELCYSYLWKIDKNGYYSQFDKDWWNAPYEKGEQYDG